MTTRRLSFTHDELGVLAQALREALAAQLLSPDSVHTARALLDRVDAKLPDAIEQHPAGASAGRLLAGDEILRLLLAHEDRYRDAALSNEDIARELDWKPAGSSVRDLLEDLRRARWLAARGTGAERRYQLTGKGRGRARALKGGGTAPDGEARVDKAEDLLDLIYQDSTPCATHSPCHAEQSVPGIWHRPTVQAAGRLSDARLAQLEGTLRADGLIAEHIHSYHTLTQAGEDLARQRWHATQPHGYGGPPRLARPHHRAREVIALAGDRACPNCGHAASWLRRRASRRWDELHGRGETDYTCPGCDVRWTIYLEPTDPNGHYHPLGDPTTCRPRWRYRAGYLHDNAPAPPDHHPQLAAR
jgi:DNA-directed RNA polymerase subunit M/transcription elongation factor TFIIS